MAKPKKDGRYINYYLDRRVYENLEAYAQSKGQTMTMALECIITDYLEGQCGNKQNKGNDCGGMK